MTLSKKTLILGCFLLLCVMLTGCDLLAIPFQVLGSALGLAGQAAQIGIAAAPYAAPFFL